MSLVAFTPVAGRPLRSPASRPAFASLWTQSPTSSRSGWVMMPWRECTPTCPVLHWTTRSAMRGTVLERVLFCCVLWCGGRRDDAAPGADEQDDRHDDADRQRDDVADLVARVVHVE